VVRVLETLLKNKEKLKSLYLKRFLVLGQIKCEDGSVSYQGVDLKNHDRSITYLKTHTHEWMQPADRQYRFKSHKMWSYAF